MCENEKKWLEEQQPNVSISEYKLLQRAVTVLKNNIAAGENLPWSPFRCILPGTNDFDGIWNWDTAFHVMAVSRWDIQLAKECILGFMKFQKDDGMFPDVIWKNGIIEDRFTKPPVLPWAAELIYRRGGGIDFIRQVYPQFKKNERFWTENRCDRGLFYYDSQDKGEPDYELHAGYETGWDNSIRWDVPVAEQWAVDLNCYMVMMYRSMRYFADEIGLDDDAAMWAQKEKTLTALIEENLWDDELQSYSDINRFSGKGTKALTPACFMPLFIKISSAERAECMNRLAEDKNKFRGGMPSAAYDHPGYSNDYWRGPTWLNIAYFAAKGLNNYGFASGDQIKDTILSWCEAETRGIFENYNSQTGEGMCCDHFSWSAAFMIEFILNF